MIPPQWPVCLSGLSPGIGSSVFFIPIYQFDSHLALALWYPIPPNGYRYPNHPRLQIIPWDLSMYGIDSLLGSQIPWTSWIPDSLLAVWDSLGYWIRGYSSRILLFTSSQVKSSSGATRPQYQDVDNQNSKHNMEACGTISSSNSIVKIDSIFLMALLY